MANYNTNYFKGGANLMDSLLSRMQAGIQMNINERRYRDEAAFRERSYQDSRALAMSAEERAQQQHELAIEEAEYQQGQRPSASFMAGLNRKSLEIDAAMKENQLTQSNIYTGMLEDYIEPTATGVPGVASDNPAFFVSKGGSTGTAVPGAPRRTSSGISAIGGGRSGSGPTIQHIPPEDRVMEVDPKSPHLVEDRAGNLNLERPLSEMRENIISGDATKVGDQFARQYVGSRGSGKHEPWIGKRNFAPEAIEEGWYGALLEYMSATNDLDLPNLEEFRRSFAKTAGGSTFNKDKLHIPTELFADRGDGRIDTQKRGEFIQALQYDQKIKQNVEERVNKGVNEGAWLRDNYTVAETEADMEQIFMDITGDETPGEFKRILGELQEGRNQAKQGKSLFGSNPQDQYKMNTVKSIQRHMYNQLEMAKARTTGYTWPKVHELPNEVDATDFGQSGTKGGHLGPQPGDIDRIGPLVFKYRSSAEGYKSGSLGGGY
jgi:hypothetical protein